MVNTYSLDKDGLKFAPKIVILQSLENTKRNLWWFGYISMSSSLAKTIPQGTVVEGKRGRRRRDGKTISKGVQKCKRNKCI